MQALCGSELSFDVPSFSILSTYSKEMFVFKGKEFGSVKVVNQSIPIITRNMYSPLLSSSSPATFTCSPRKTKRCLSQSWFSPFSAATPRTTSISSRFSSRTAGTCSCPSPRSCSRSGRSTHTSLCTSRRRQRHFPPPRPRSTPSSFRTTPRRTPKTPSMFRPTSSSCSASCAASPISPSIPSTPSRFAPKLQKPNEQSKPRAAPPPFSSSSTS